MFFVTLRFSTNKPRAPEFMEAHNAWIRRGFDDGIFLLSGSILPGVGGAILAHNIERIDLEALVRADPFVAQDVVSAEIVEISPAKTDERLAFLKA